MLMINILTKEKVKEWNDVSCVFDFKKLGPTQKVIYLGSLNYQVFITQK